MMGQAADSSGVRYMWYPIWSFSPERFVAGSFRNRPLLPGDEWARVDSLFERVTTYPRKTLAVLLMDNQFPSLGHRGDENQTRVERAAIDIYVLYEPVMSVVLAVDIDGKDVSVVADSNLWPSLGHRFRDVMDGGRQLLSVNRLVDALVFCIGRLGEMM